MEILYKTFVSSYNARFSVGTAKRSFYVHGALVKQHSKTLAAFNELSSEKSGKSALLVDIDEDTFIRFIEYAYTGDYTVSEPDGIPLINGVTVEEPVEPDAEPAPPIEEELPPHEESPFDGAVSEHIEPMPEQSWGTGLTKKKKRGQWEYGYTFELDKDMPVPDEYPAEEPWVEEAPEEVLSQVPSPRYYTSEDVLPDAVEMEESIEEGMGSGLEANTTDIDGKTKKSSLWIEFTKQATVKTTAPWEPRDTSNPNEDFTPVFLCHAKLYAFSVRFEIQPLKELVLQKLRLTLSRFNLLPERTKMVVELLKYTYADTVDRKRGWDLLRDMLTHYVACHLETLSKDEAFLKLLQEAGPLSKDLVLKILRRLD